MSSLRASTHHIFSILLLFLVSSCDPAPGARWTEPITGMEFIRVEPGEFLMGSPEEEAGREAQEIQHPVRISRAFYMGVYEVTQQQWQTVMGENPSAFPDCGPSCPVERVNYFGVQTFISKLGKLTGHAFRLPSEAEWEYSCRAGTTTPFNTGPGVTTEQANFAGRMPYPGSPAGVSRETPTPVGSFPPNAWGLYDMHGNVWEWTQDWHCPYPEEAVIDPLGSCETKFRVIRGGSWYFDANSTRCALRYTHEPIDLGFSLGFRLVMDPSFAEASEGRPSLSPRFRGWLLLRRGFVG